MRELTKELGLIIGFVVSLFICLCIILSGSVIAFLVIPSSSPPPPEEEASPAWSPDGQRIAFECYLDGPTQGVFESNLRRYSLAAADICVANADGSQRVRLAANKVADLSPTWSPDGTRIAYISEDGIYIINSDGSNQRRLVPVDIPNVGFTGVPGKATWSPDGEYLAFSACLKTQERDVFVVDVTDGALTNLTKGNHARDMGPMWLPNSKQLVFLSSDLPLEDSCAPFPMSSTSRLKSIDIDGANEKSIYGEAFYTSISVSPTGQIAFVANMRATNYIEEADLIQDTHLYTIRPGDEEPIVWESFRGVSWSPDGRYLTNGEYVLDLETGEKRRLPAAFSPDGYIGWSPDGRKLATTSLQEVALGSLFAQRILILDLDRNTVRPLFPREE